MKETVKRIIALLMGIIIAFNLVACSSKQDSNAIPEDSLGLVESDNNDGSGSSDDLKTIKIKDLKINEINVVSVDPQDINIKSINVKGIQSIEVQVIPLNDQMVTLAYENFKSVYGDNIDIGKLIANTAVGAVCVVVIVGLSYVGGPVGTFFGAVITSELSAVAVVLGVAIDAAISAYQAYKEGGDAAYIVGHMLNGVAEGFMWSAILAPLSGAFQGIRALRAVSKIRKIPGLEKLTDKEITKVLRNLSKYVKHMKDVAGNETDEMLIKLYRSLPKELQQNLTEEAFKILVRSKDTLISIVLKENPFGIKSQVVDALRENFWKKLEVSDDVAKDLIRKIQKGTYKNLDDITDPQLRELIKKNSSEFIELFSDKFSKDFVENWLKASIGEKTFQTIKKNITTNKGLLQISKELGHDTLSKILNNTEQYKLLVRRFGSENISRLKSIDDLFRIVAGQSTLDERLVYDIIEKMLKGNLDLSDVNQKIFATNIKRYSESVAIILKNLGLERNNKKLLYDLAIESLSNIDGISKEIANDIISNRLSKAGIISKYGDDTWKKITDNGHFSIVCLNIVSDADLSLLKEVTTDALKTKGCSEQVIEKILRGESCSAWNLSDKKITDIGNIVSEYYGALKKDYLSNFIDEYAEIRGRTIASVVEKYQKNNTMRNLKYAGGVMVPAVDDPNYILNKYGQIKMSRYGFAVFDEHSIARVVIDDLTGDEDIDLALANMKHHGTKQSIPGYTWHHLEDGKTLILIPTELHDAYKHTGGAALIREGLVP